MEASEREFNIRIMICILVVIVMTVFIVLFIKTRFAKYSIIQSIDNKETILIYVESTECGDCNNVEKTLKKKKVNYNYINKDKDKVYKSIIKKLKIEDSDLPSPALIYISEGVKYATLVEITDMNELNYFIKYYELDNTKKGS